MRVHLFVYFKRNEEKRLRKIRVSSSAPIGARIDCARSRRNRRRCMFRVGVRIDPLTGSRNGGAIGAGPSFEPGGANLGRVERVER